MEFTYRLIMYVLMANVGFMVFSLIGKGLRVYFGYVAQLVLFLAFMGWTIARDMSGPSALGWSLTGLFLMIILPVMLQKYMEKLIAEQRFHEVKMAARVKAALAWSELNRHMVEIAGAVEDSIEDVAGAEERLKELLGRGEPFDGMTRMFLAMVHFHAREFGRLIDDLVIPEKKLEECSFEELLYIVRGYLETGRYQEAIAAQSALEKAGSRRESEEQQGNVLVNRMLFFAFFGWTDDFTRLVATDSPAVKSLPEALIRFWNGVAIFHSGDFAAGRECMERALQQAHEQLPDLWTNWMDSRIKSLMNGQERFAAETLPTLKEMRASRREEVLKLMGTVDQETQIVPMDHGVTNQLTFLLILTFVLANRFGNVEDLLDLLYLGGNSGWMVSRGEWYRLISSLFLHIGWIHLLMNVFALRFFGPPLETGVGRPFFWGVFFFSGLLGGLASAFLQQGISAGASGAVLGLLSAAIVLEWSGDREMRRIAPQGNMATMLFILFINMLVGFVEKGVDNHAHLGGLFGGAVAGALIRLVSLNQGLRLLAQWVTMILVGIVLLLASYGYASHFRDRSYPAPEVLVVPVTEAIPLAFGLPPGWVVEKGEQKPSVHMRMLVGPVGERISLTWGEFDEPVESFLAEYSQDRTRSIADGKGLELKTYQEPKQSIRKNGIFYQMQWRFLGGGRPFVERDALGLLGRNFILIQALVPTARIEKYDPLLENLLDSIRIP
jgi:membrane associated rhomboid family serine protease